MQSLSSIVRATLAPIVRAPARTRSPAEALVSPRGDQRPRPQPLTTGSTLASPVGVLTPWIGVFCIATFQLAAWIVCNPVSGAITGSTHAAERALAGAIPDKLRFVGEPALDMLLGSLVGGATADVRFMTVGIAFLFAFLIPILVTIASASSLHLGSMVTGGAPGGWRRTFREVALNRVVSDGGSLFVLLLLNALPLSLDTHIGLSLALLALLRIGLLIHLLARMVKGHQMNATRTCLLGLPGLCLSAIVAMALSVAPAFWFWAHCVVRTALG